MANTVIALKKSATPTAAPADLANGELAINYADGKLYYKNVTGQIVSISSGGNNFGTVNANNTLVVADTAGDILTLAPGNNISIVGDAVNDQITIALKDDIVITGSLFMNNRPGAGGSSEGGEMLFANSTSATQSLSGPIVIDIYENKLRFFERDGTNRGVYIEFPAAGATVGTNLLATAGSSTDATARDWAGSAFAKANAALPNTSGVTFNGSLTVSSNLSADRVFSTNNGNGENFKIGDDAWFGDTNLADTVRLKGQQNASNGYIIFGTNDGISLGRNGSNALTYGGNTVWHAGNDGAGSGLDADLLDGQHGSYYGVAADVTAAFDKANTANITADLAYNHANAAHLTANAAFNTANAALPNTSGVSFVGNLNFPSGNVGIGTSSPTANLHVSGLLFVTQNNSTSLAAIGEIAEFAHNANSYTQIHVRNANTGTQASGDIVVTADSGTDSIDFVDLGINSSGYSQAGWTINGAKDAYLYASNGNFAIGVSNVARSLTFFTGGTLAANERARFDPTGNLLIGRTDSTVGQSVKVDVNGAINASAVLVNGTAVGSGGITLTDQSTVTQLQYPLFTTRTSGSASVANVASTKLTYNVATGTLSTTNFNSTSDINKKENVTTLQYPFDILSEIYGVRFTWKDNKLPSVGVIAQDVEKVLPELVGDEKSVNYNGLIAVLIEAIKELKAEIEILKSKQNGI